MTTQTMSTQELTERLARVQALYERASSEGERAAAAEAKERILARLWSISPSAAVAAQRATAARETAARETTARETGVGQATTQEPTREYRFSIRDEGARLVFLALLKRLETVPRRRKGQRRTTIVVEVSAGLHAQLSREWRQLEGLLERRRMAAARDLAEDVKARRV